MKNAKYEFLRNIVRRTTNFETLTEEQKLVIAAKDVKKALEIGLIKPVKGTYFSTNDNKPLNANNVLYCCALGALETFIIFNKNKKVEIDDVGGCYPAPRGIERYFEGWRKYVGNNNIPSDQKILNICNNIIENKGKFTL